MAAQNQRVVQNNNIPFGQWKAFNDAHWNQRPYDRWTDPIYMIEPSPRYLDKTMPSLAVWCDILNNAWIHEKKGRDLGNWMFPLQRIALLQTELLNPKSTKPPGGRTDPATLWHHNVRKNFCNLSGNEMRIFGNEICRLPPGLYLRTFGKVNGVETEKRPLGVIPMEHTYLALLKAHRDHVGRDATFKNLGNDRGGITKSLVNEFLQKCNHPSCLKRANGGKAASALGKKRPHEQEPDVEQVKSNKRPRAMVSRHQFQFQGNPSPLPQLPLPGLPLQNIQQPQLVPHQPQQGLGGVNNHNNNFEFIDHVQERHFGPVPNPNPIQRGLGGVNNHNNNFEMGQVQEQHFHPAPNPIPAQPALPSPPIDLLIPPDHNPKSMGSDINQCPKDLAKEDHEKLADADKDYQELFLDHALRLPSPLSPSSSFPSESVQAVPGNTTPGVEATEQERPSPNDNFANDTSASLTRELGNQASGQLEGPLEEQFYEALSRSLDPIKDWINDQAQL